MTEIELRAPHWKRLTEELFMSEYGDSKDEKERFYSKFSGPINLYQELANRILTDSTQEAYRLMYDSYMEDASNNNHNQLDTLVNTYIEKEE